MTKLLAIAIVVAAFAVGSAVAAVATLSLSATSRPIVRVTEQITSPANANVQPAGMHQGLNTTLPAGTTCLIAVEADTAFGTLSTGLVTGMWYYTASIQEPAGVPWIATSFFRVDLSADGVPKGTLYIKQAQGKGAIEGVNVFFNLGVPNLDSLLPTSYVLTVTFLGSTCS
jgi:hypothetical protein